MGCSEIMSPNATEINILKPGFGPSLFTDACPPDHRTNKVAWTMKEKDLVLGFQYMKNICLIVLSCPTDAQTECVLSQRTVNKFKESIKEHKKGSICQHLEVAFFPMLEIPNGRSQIK